MADKSNDIVGLFSDIRQTGTKELGKTASSLLSSTPPKQPTAGGKISSGPSFSGNQISVDQEKREKEVIDRRKIV